MKQIPLSRGLTAIVDDEDYELLSKYTWCAQDGDYPYAITGAGITRKKMHRLIMNATSGVDVDHINRNVLDNRKQNLRLCSRAQNTRNRGKQRNNTSGWKGAYFDKRAKDKPWQSIITSYGKTKSLGYYKTAEEAARAYDAAAAEIYGEFANVNFPVRMTKSARRAAYPEFAVFADDKRKHFEGSEVSYTAMPGYEWGAKCPEGVPATVDHYQLKVN